MADAKLEKRILEDLRARHRYVEGVTKRYLNKEKYLVAFSFVNEFRHEGCFEGYYGKNYTAVPLYLTFNIKKLAKELVDENLVDSVSAFENDAKNYLAARIIEHIDNALRVPKEFQLKLLINQ